MRWIGLAVALFVACSSTTEPPDGAYSYSSTINGERVTGTITLSDSPGFHISGSYNLGGETGEVDGAVVENEVHFLIIGFRGDTLRHVAVRGDTLAGQWERGTVVNGSWSGTGDTGTFRAVR